MPGAVETITSTSITGWAQHPTQKDYKVLVHVMSAGQVLASAIADAAEGDESEHADSRFSIAIEHLGLRDADLRRLIVIVAETNEILSPPASSGGAPSEVTRVEDILNASSVRKWITGRTCVELRREGVDLELLVELIYLDLLGRKADPAGLQTYLQLLYASKIDLMNLRKALVQSPEYCDSLKFYRGIPGALFSDILLAIGVCSRELADTIWSA